MTHTLNITMSCLTRNPLAWRVTLSVVDDFWSASSILAGQCVGREYVYIYIYVLQTACPWNWRAVRIHTQHSHREHIIHTPIFWCSLSNKPSERGSPIFLPLLSHCTHMTW